MTTKELQRGSAAIVLGGLFGAGVALMVAPTSGRETRRRIVDFADDVKERARCYSLRGKDRVVSVVHEGKHFFQDKKSLLTTAIEAGRTAYQKEKERLVRKH